MRQDQNSARMRWSPAGEPKAATALREGLLQHADQLIAESKALVVRAVQAVDETRDIWRTTERLIEDSRKHLDADRYPLRKRSQGRGESPMDRRIVLEHLEQARTHIAEGEEHIRHQREIIAGLARDGHDTALADEILATLEKTQAHHIAQHELLLEELKGAR